MFSKKYSMKNNIDYGLLYFFFHLQFWGEIDGLYLLSTGYQIPIKLRFTTSFMYLKIFQACSTLSITSISQMKIDLEI